MCSDNTCCEVIQGDTSMNRGPRWWELILPLFVIRIINNRYNKKHYSKEQLDIMNCLSNEEFEQYKEEEVHPESHPMWGGRLHGGWDAAFQEIGRMHYHLGPMVSYDKYVIGIDNQRIHLKSEKNRSWVKVTPILPFDEVYTGRPAVSL